MVLCHPWCDDAHTSWESSAPSAAGTTDVCLPSCLSSQILQCFWRTQKWFAFSWTCSGDQTPYPVTEMEDNLVVPTLRSADPHDKYHCWHPSRNELQQRNSFQTRRENRPRRMCHLSSGLPAYKWSYTSLIWKEDMVIHSFIVSSVLRQVRSFFHSEVWRECHLVLPVPDSSIFSFP